jgi:hypothetical protein
MEVIVEIGGACARQMKSARYQSWLIAQPAYTRANARKDVMP